MNRPTGSGAWTRVAGLLAAVSASWLVSGPQAVAQCVMCSQAAENAGDPEVVSATFEIAILILLLPTLCLLGAAGFLLWRFRGTPGAAPAAPRVHRRDHRPRRTGILLRFSARKPRRDELP